MEPIKPMIYVQDICESCPGLVWVMSGPDHVRSYLSHIRVKSGIFRFVWVTSKSCPVISGACLGHFWVMSGSHLSHVWVMPELCPGMSRSCFSHVRGMSMSCAGHVRVISNSCEGHIWIMPRSHLGQSCLGNV